MKKQELVYMHGLLVEVREYYERVSGATVDTPEYDACQVRPTGIHRSKPAHEEAVTTLARELTDAMADRQQMTAD
jgi:hypothetical protein